MNILQEIYLLEKELEKQWQNKDCIFGAQQFAKVLSARVKNCSIADVSVSFERRQKLAESILLALLQNPERYKYIADKVESGDLGQEEANMKNIHKAYKIADSFLSVGENAL